MRSRTILAVAARWGFTDGANFSRAFRASYGMPPGDYGHLHAFGVVRELTRTVQATTRTFRSFLDTLVPGNDRSS
ncbi:helix-turn-helix domain-containing protein [Embleya sp. NPDC020630]|uniref:helix-turn-helix domain-containing protein n=1 Tax=Embleya sp. NPDC020630 TaxID=3363979 RepID=UPI0037A1E692